MKNSIFSVAIIPALLFILNISLSAQTTATWQGGKPGRCTDWNCAANWSEGRIPGEFTQVIIPADVQWYPVIKSSPAPIDALLMEGGTRLTIQHGATLLVLCETGRFGGITALSEIENNGTLEVGYALHTNMALLQQVHGNGAVAGPPAGVDTRARRH